jgi:peptidoglycan hydrolase-like protein with peptidoglycan-binding domain
VSLGTQNAIAAGPAAGLADSKGRVSAAAEPPTTASHRLTLKSGSEGRQVRLLQHALGIVVDGVYGPATESAVRAYQASRGLAVDGVVGPHTSAALANSPATAHATHSAASADSPAIAHAAHSASKTAVMRLQEALHVQVDGAFGPETEAAVRSLQARHGLTVDGIVGPQTWSALHMSGQAVLHEASRHAASGTATHARTADHARSRSDRRTATQSASSRGSSGGTRTESSAGDPISRLQEALHVQVDGAFGPETEAAVRSLQARHGLTVDGVVGPQTWSALGIEETVTLHPPHRDASHAHESASEPSSSDSSIVARVIAAANEIATRPYVYGGGHGSFQSTGYDCSGSVSYALHGGGLLSSPEDSSELESYGEPGPGRHITIYANSEHAWMVVDGRRFDTIAQQETGTRWSSSTMSTAGYVVRHPAGL